MDQQAKQVKFSIITAAYNIGNYIQRAIESVEKQNFSDYEFIIINDCSTNKETIQQLDLQFDFNEDNENKEEILNSYI